MGLWTATPIHLPKAVRNLTPLILAFASRMSYVVRHIDPYLLNQSRINKQKMNHAEVRLWWDLRNTQFGVRFRRQHVVHGCLLDFACLPIRLDIETDGSQHHDSESDHVRDALLQSHGWTVLRFWTPTCFDNPAGGMGIHYVRNIDGIVDANDPEALVYEVRPNGQTKLVAVEYIVPETEVDPANPPMLYGHMFHPHAFLPVYILHVWVWKTNPDGLFADFNPNVTPCP